MANEFNDVENLVAKSLKPKQEPHPGFKSNLDRKLNQNIIKLKTMQQGNDQTATNYSFFEKLRLAFWGNNKKRFATLFTMVLIIMPSAMAALVLLGYTPTIFGPLLPGAKVASVDLQATSISANGVKQDSEFILTTEEDFDIENLKKAIKTSPEFEYELTRIDQGFKLKPKAVLEKDLLYEVKLEGEKIKSEGWNFRVEPAFAVINSSPEHEAPINSSIEFNFNYADIDLESFKSALRIHPEVPIKSIEQRGSTIVVIPSENLIPGRSYDLFVDNTVKRLNQEYMKNPYQSYLSTVDETNNKTPYIYFPSETGSVIEVVPNSRKVVMQISDSKPNTKATITLYRVKQDSIVNTARELYAYGSWRAIKVSSSFLEKISSQEVTAQETITYTLPVLKTGDLVYVEMSYQGQLEGKYYSNTKMAGSITAMQNELIISLFDTNGKITSGGKATIIYRDLNNLLQVKEVTLDGVTRINKADIGYKDGILGAVMEAGEDRIILLNDFFSYDYYDASGSEQSATYNNNILTYFMFDKPIYRNGDKVSFKTLLKYSEDYTTFSPYDVSGLEYIIYVNDKIVSRNKPDSVNKENGYITGTFSLPQTMFSYMDIYVARVDIVRGSEKLATGSIGVREYVKPKYTLDVNVAEQKIYEEGEEVEFRIKAKDMAGNPLVDKNIEIIFGYTQSYRSSWYDEVVSYYGAPAIDKVIEQKVIKLDSSGQTVLKYKVPAAEIDNTSDFFYTTLEVNVDKQITASKSVESTKGDITVMVKDTGTTSWRSAGEEGKLRVKTVDPETLKGLKAEISKLEVNRVWTETVEHTAYNYLTRTNEKYYTYNTHTDLISTQLNLKTNDNGELELVYKYDLPGYYDYTFTFLDTKGKSVVYKAAYLVNIYDKAGGGYSVESQPSITTDKQIYQIGDKAKVQIDFPEKMVNGSDAFLIIFKDKIYHMEKIQVQKKTYNFEYEITKELSPNAAIRLVSSGDVKDYGFSLDSGYRVVNSVTSSLIIRRDEDMLKVNLKTDKQAYQPGEKVKLQINVTDENSRTVGNASLNIRVFDKSLLTVLGKETFEKDIYEMVFGSYRRKSSGFSFPVIPYGGRGDGGGGQLDGIRRNFKEVAAFESSLITDNSGSAEIEFTLPDSITTWVIDVDAFTEGLNIGNSYHEITGNKDRLLDVSLPSVVKEGDELTSKVVAYNYSDQDLTGRLVIEADENVGLEYSEQPITVTKQSATSREFILRFNESTVSGSKVTIKLLDQDNQLVDGIEKNISIQKLGFPATEVKHTRLVSGENKISFSLGEDVSQSSANLLITPDSYSASFYPRATYINSTEERSAVLIQNVAIYQNYDKASDRISIAKDYLGEQIALTISSMADTQKQEGGYGFFTYSPVDLMSSTSVAYALGEAKSAGFTDQVNNWSGLSNYLSQQLVTQEGAVNDTTAFSDKVLATWALSYLGDPRALNYAQLLKSQLTGKEANAEVALLADALFTAGSPADAETLTLKLYEKVKEEDGQLFLPAEKQPYSENDNLATVLFWDLANKLNLETEIREKVGGWLVANSSVSSTAVEEAVLAKLFIKYSEESEIDNREIALNINGKELYSGLLGEYGDSFVLTDLKAGQNEIKITTPTDGFVARLAISDVTESQVTNTQEFSVKTEFLPLETFIPSDTLPKGEYIVLRVTVNSTKEHQGFKVRTYIPSGLTTSTAVPSRINSTAYFDWVTRPGRVNKWPQVSNNQVIFTGFYDEKYPTQVFEMLLVSDYKGQFKTNGTFVYYEGKSTFAGYETGKTIKVN